jgi:hypothetical protein
MSDCWAWRSCVVCLAAAPCRRRVRSGPPGDLLAELPGGPWVAHGGAVLTVEADVVAVERRLAAGGVSCPGCGGRLAPWGWARPRVPRGPEGLRVLVRPRRACCRRCGATHVLLPVVALARRADLVEVIGAALAAKAAGGVPGDRWGAGAAGGHGAGLVAPVRCAGGGRAGGVHGVVGGYRSGSGGAGRGGPCGGGCGGRDRGGCGGGGGAVATGGRGVAVVGRLRGFQWSVVVTVLALIDDQHELPLPVRMLVWHRRRVCPRET